MTHVLFITEKYHSGPNYGLTNHIYNLVGSYECSGYGTYEHHFIDPENIWSSQGVDAVLMSQSYDAAIISVYHHLPSPGVAAKIGHKTFMCWWDSIISMGGVMGWAGMIHQACFDWGKGQEHPNCYCVDVPQDTRKFYRDSNVVKDIDVSFVGSIGSPWSDRANTINKIKEAGINIWAGGGRGPGYDNLSIDEYANMFRRSKICLNLSYGHGRPQRKGRSFEIAASGAFMLTNCPEMFNGKEGNWFDENVDYVSFNDNNLIEKIHYYLNNDSERNEIADNIYNKYMSYYAPNHFWSKILNICGAKH